MKEFDTFVRATEEMFRHLDARLENHEQRLIHARKAIDSMQEALSQLAAFVNLGADGALQR